MQGKRAEASREQKRYLKRVVEYISLQPKHTHTSRLSSVVLCISSSILFASPVVRIYYTTNVYVCEYTGE